MGNTKKDYIEYGKEINARDFPEGAANTPTSRRDKLAVAAFLASAPFRLIKYKLDHMMKRSHDEANLRLLATMCRNLSMLQCRIILYNRPLRECLGDYISFAAKHKLNNFNKLFKDKRNNPERFTARWIHEQPNRGPDDLVLVYLHGGGFYVKTTTVQTEWMIQFMGQFVNRKVSLLVLDYTVTPFGQFPDQIEELLYLWEALADTTSNIGVLGDSAGSNMALSLGLHTLDPIPGLIPVDPRVPLPTMALFASPWVTQPTADEPNRREKDILTLRFLMEFAASYGTRDEWESKYVDILGAASHEEIRKSLPKRTAIVWGGRELLARSCKQLADIIEAPVAFEEKNAIHDCVFQPFKTECTAKLTEALNMWLDEDGASPKKSKTEAAAAKSEAASKATPSSEPEPVQDTTDGSKEKIDSEPKAEDPSSEPVAASA